MFDRNALEYEMKKKDISVDEMIAECHMSRSAWYRKLKGTTQFTLAEIETISSRLEKTPAAIFFVNEVS